MIWNTISLLCFLLYSSINAEMLDSKSREGLLDKLISNRLSWQGLNEIKVKYDNRLITMNFLINSSASKITFEEKARQISNILGCMYTKKLKLIVNLAKRVIIECRKKEEHGELNSFEECVTQTVSEIALLSPLMLFLQNSLIFFYKFLPLKKIDSKDLYTALVNMHLFLNRSTQMTHLSHNILKELNFNILLFENKLNKFSLECCWYQNILSDTTKLIDNNKIQSKNNQDVVKNPLDKTKYLLEIINKTSKHVIETYYIALGFNEFVIPLAPLSNVQLLWEMLDTQHVNKVLWFNEKKNIQTVIAEVKFHHKITNLIALQSLSLRVIKEALFRKILSLIKTICLPKATYVKDYFVKPFKILYANLNHFVMSVLPNSFHDRKKSIEYQMQSKEKFNKGILNEISRLQHLNIPNEIVATLSNLNFYIRESVKNNHIEDTCRSTTQFFEMELSEIGENYWDGDTNNSNINSLLVYVNDLISVSEQFEEMVLINTILKNSVFEEEYTIKFIDCSK